MKDKWLDALIVVLSACVFFFCVYIVLTLQGCTTDTKRQHAGCEQACYLCLGYYNHCGDKSIDVQSETKKLKKDAKD